MLATRVIPTLLLRNGSLVKGTRFDSWRSIGSPVQATRTHQARGVDELAILDIGATPAGRGPDFSMIERLTEGCFSPVTVGGGVRSVADVRRLLECGADKVSIGTACYGEPGFIIRDCAERFGCQCVVYSLDVLAGNTVMTHCGKHGYSHNPVYCAKWAEDQGAGEILLTSIDRDGTLEGYDLDLIRAVSEAVSIPVIANGGCSGYENMVQAVRAGASAVAAGALFAWTDATPREASKYLQTAGIEARVT